MPPKTTWALAADAFAQIGSGPDCRLVNLRAGQFHSNQTREKKLKICFLIALMMLMSSCASFANKESYVTLQRETPTACIYGRHGTQTDDHSDFGVSRNDLGLAPEEKCAKWITKVCENVSTKMAEATGDDGRTVMRTAYQCERQTVNGRPIRTLKP